MTDDPRNDVLTLRDYVAVLQRRRWLVLVVALLVPLAAVLMSLQKAERYEASAKVLVGIGETPQGSNQRVAPERLLETTAALARAPEVARRTLVAARAPDQSIEAFLRASNAAANPNSDLVTLRVSDTDPALAMRLVTEYAREYIRYRRTLDRGRYARETGNAFLVGSPIAAVKVGPQTVRDGGLGLGLGLILAVVLAFLVDALAARVSSPEEIRARLGLPLLARLPKPARWLRRQHGLAMVAEPTGHQAEAFRSFRTNLDFFNLEQGARTIMVTSAIDKEGRSTSVANLAVALARQGRRVILVDLDLRRATLHRFFGLADQPGVTDIVLGRVALEEALMRVGSAESDADAGAARNGNGRPVHQGSLHVLTAGSPPPNIGEFVSSAGLTYLLASLVDHADLVLIDGPPLLAGGDAVALSANVDALVMVARLDSLRRPMLYEIRRVLDLCRCGKLGFVAAGVEASDAQKHLSRPPAPGLPRREWEPLKSAEE
ncbi:MAG: Wzz/FepE/Etk N-terminal domain-containing protein [Solirubrobacteraceae bacterium]